jgi:hypothetical protein
MVHHRRSRSSEESRARDRWYEAREQEREAHGYDPEEPEPIPEDPFVRIRQLINLATATKDSNVRINIISELMHLFISTQDRIRSSSESVYKKFTGVVQAKCAEFAAHPDAIENQGFQDLLKQVATAYR